MQKTFALLKNFDIISMDVRRVIMAKVGNRQYKTLICSECKGENYRVEKNVKNTDRLELNKYCPRCRKHTVHKEKK